VPPGAQPKGRFEGPLYHVSNFPEAVARAYLAFPGGVYKVDFHSRTLQTLFIPAAEETVLWASRWDHEKERTTLAFVGTDRSIHAVGERGAQVFSAPLAFDLRKYRIRSAGRLYKSQHYWVWFEPQWFLAADTLQTMPACVVTYDATGHEVGRQSVPPQPARPPQFDWSDPRFWFVEPTYTVALSGLATPPAELALLVAMKQYLLRQAQYNGGTEVSLLVPFLFSSIQFFLPNVASFPQAATGLVAGFAALMLLSAVACGLVCFLLPRHSAFSRARRMGWTLCGLAWGPTGLLLMLALVEWPARIACPKCRKPRVVTRDRCEHCGAPHALPAPDGTEIFEEIAAAPHALAAN
jgi:hypothetical protein